MSLGRNVQVNKQTTIVKVNTKISCRSRKKKKHCRRKKIKCFCEEVCGTIFQKCDSKPQVYFRAVEIRPSANVKIQNDTNCDMEAMIRTRKKEITQVIGQSQQVSIVVPSISRLTIVCNGDGSQVCRGRYDIKLRIRTHRTHRH
ncbi:S-Ena type endospore appendage [Paenibacillus sonchi]|uniref:S-Ena type endospore appendage n=1 Tax=Paenibacillus sonchi TaxID=373687 RepID=UPI00398B0E8C